MRPSYTQEADFRQQRDFGQKFSATFEFIGEHWRGLGQAMLYIVLPGALLQGIVSGLVQVDMQKRLRGAEAGVTYTTGVLGRLGSLRGLSESPYYWVSIAMGAMLVSLLALAVYGYMLQCMRPQPSSQPITVGQVWAVVQAQFLSSFLSYFGVAILVIVGFFFLGVPGIYLSVVLSLFYVVKVMEGTGFWDTFSRCRRLISGKWWSTFGLMFVMLMAVVIMFSVLGGLFGAFLGWSGMYRNMGASKGIITIIFTSLAGLVNLLIYPPLLIALAFQYFNLVERKEGVGLRHMVDQLGQKPAAVQNAAYQADEEGEY